MTDEVEKLIRHADRYGWGRTQYKAREVLHAVNGARVKWDEVADGSKVDYGCNNCPLCYLFLGEQMEDDCGECPVKVTTGLPSCSGSPWQMWRNHHMSLHKDSILTVTGYKVDCPMCKALAMQCSDFLTGLHKQLEGLLFGGEVALGDLFREQLVEVEDAKHGN